MDKRKVSVVLVDDYPLFRKAMADVLNATGDFVVTGQTSEENTALGLASLQPDLVILDLDARSHPSIEILKEVKKRSPGTRVVMMLNSEDSASALMEAIRQDVNGYLLRSEPIDEFVRQIREAAAGRMATSEKITSALAEHLRTGTLQTEERSTKLLTRRELDVLACVATGLSNREIARFLNITDGTVKVHVKHLLKKLRFRSRVEAAVWGSEHGHRIPLEDLKVRGIQPTAAHSM